LLQLLKQESTLMFSYEYFLTPSKLIELLSINAY
jgi:hypothetical protein